MRKYVQGFILSALLAAPAITMGAGEYTGERNSFGRFHGQGTYTTSRGDTYEGSWVDGRKSGKGSYVWKNGDKYVGEWKNNKRNGQGTMFYATGDVYKGEWSANRARGEGVMRYKNKDVYKGLFKDGEPGGEGKMVYANGDRYVGNWVGGLPSGKGVYHLKNGDKVFAKWKAGAIEKGSTKYRFAEGLEYKGPLKKLVPNGKGTCSEKGKSSPCQYRNGKAVVAKVAAKPKPVAAKPKAVQVAKVEARARSKPILKPAVAPPKPKAYMSNKVEFNLKHDWVKGGGFGVPTEIICKVVEDDLDETRVLYITAKSAEMSVRMKVNDYRGAGEYALPFYSARAKFKTVGGYATTDEKPGKLVVTRDNGKLISATFSFEGYPNGNVSLGKQRTIKKGRVTAIPIFE